MVKPASFRSNSIYKVFQVPKYYYSPVKSDRPITVERLPFVRI